MEFDHLFFDLDGTLTDSREGITRCLQHALGALDEPCPPAPELERFIGPSLADAFRVLLTRPDADRVDRAIALYRQRFSDEGLYENELIGGIPELLEMLFQSGRTLYVVTSKPEIYARRIVEHFGLDSRMRAVHGAFLDGRRSRKQELIEHVLADEDIPRTRAVMIGDREHDVLGARAAGVASLGVTWGFGSRCELELAGATGIVESPAQCAAWLGAVGNLDGSMR